MAFAVQGTAAGGDAIAEVIELKGRVEVLRDGATGWAAVVKGEKLFGGDRVRTGERSEATLFMASDEARLPIREFTDIQLERRERIPILRVLRGALYFFHRGRPQGIEVWSRGANAGVLGTEFAFVADEDGTVQLTLYDGIVVLSNALGRLELKTGDIATASPGRAPHKTAVLMPNDFSAIQWAVYYPAILDLGDLGWTAAPDPELTDSLAAYRSGNLPQAMAKYPELRTPASGPEQVYLASLLLAIGSISEARTILDALPDDPHLQRLAAAQRQLIAAVLRQDCRTAEGFTNLLATELLAVSYCRQSQGKLEDALSAARSATETSPELGFAWARRAELEFGFGRIRSATIMVERALALTPENAAALALRGFLLAAGNATAEAERSFESALAIDGSLGNAWLGRGLCRIRRGDLQAGRDDLQMAAAVEPQRSLLRSYLAKAFADSRLLVVPSLAGKARHELDLARRLDPFDPTPWLYQSLLDREENRIADGIRALDIAQDLVANRALYRSEPLLDQDRAVAGANQAVAYRDAGMTEVGIQTARRAVATDYANPAAHQFLAESYANSDRANLRDETPRVSEYLVANLLAPVGAGLLSPTLSQQEYSKLFERDGVGGFSQTAYLSRGAWSQSGGTVGTFGTSAFLAEGFYQTDPGYVANNDFEQYGFTVQIKEQVGPRDTVYAQTLFSELDAGDLSLRYDPREADPDARVTERLAPAVLAGWHRDWGNEHRTLALAGWFEDRLTIENLDPGDTTFAGPVLPGRAEAYASDFGLFTTEAQHLWTPERHAVVLGARWQTGTFDVHASSELIPGHILESVDRVQPGFGRFQMYAYDTWRLGERLHLTAGVGYDDVRYPINHRDPPLSDDEDRRTQVSPKVGAVWEVARRTWLRAAYTRSLGGVSFDQSLRLEPTQVAGFNQAFRSLIPESVAGANSVPGFETLGVALETRLTTNTWVSLSGELLSSEVKRWYGYDNPGEGPVQLPQELGYDERAIQGTVNRLLGAGWSVGGRYRVSEVELRNSDPRPAVELAHDRAVLQTLGLSARFNYPSGFFAGAEALWFHQDDGGDLVYPSEDVWQLNVWGGWRLLRRRAEIVVGLVNLTDQDYRLNPLGVITAPGRERTFFARFSWNW